MVESLSDLLSFKKILVLGVGGGGDVVSASIIALMLSDLGIDCFVGGVSWERWSRDPFPGPVSLTRYVNVDLGDGYALIRNDSLVDRGLVRFKPTLAFIKEVTGLPCIVFDLCHGWLGVTKGLRSFIERYGIEFVLGVDVGGDILALGYEDGLWSPLADQLTLSGIASLSTPSLIGVLGVGGDGELDPNYVINRISCLASIGGYVGSLGVFTKYLSTYRRLVELTGTEASKVPYLALSGYLGRLSIRDGTRYAEVDVSKSVLYLLKTETIFSNQPLPKALVGTETITEAMRRANELGIYTELNLELKIAKEIGTGKKAKYKEIMEKAIEEKNEIRRIYGKMSYQPN
ncbi:MAG TPA: DUF1152 domain-containing protein [Acidilobales archaeon]|nr:MAG: hypothetical protein DRO18_03910 [Thermoprotei archaeon]HDD26080.1 DUF1152 domain-containing protein [Acidilobales archaeon]